MEWYPQLQAKQSLFPKHSSVQTRRSFWLAGTLLLFLGLLVRVGFLHWQPLWADEGYSVYFATEAVARMLWLTAHDIHPPFYYLLLHGWLLWWTADPMVLRSFSVLLAVPVFGVGVALAHTLFVGRRQPQLLFLLLLIWSPLHLYYSQEIRMYGLALTVSMAATLCCWRWVSWITQGKAAAGWLLCYLVTAALSLYTLYYLAFLLLAHLLWVHWALRKQRSSLLRFWLAEIGVGLLYLPWVIYTARLLVTYVNDKIRSDQDVALGLGAYLARHLLAFTSGHLPFPALLAQLSWLALLVSVALLLWSLWRWRFHSVQTFAPNAQSLLWLCIALPFGAGYGINRFYPFFPEGGERLLLFVLPYFLLLIAGSLDDLWRRAALWRVSLGAVALLLLLTPAVVGVWVFYTLPRYAEDDYRPVIRQIVQQGADADTVLATFPWQVGLWRAYAPQAGLTAASGPRIQLLSERAVRWEPAVVALVDAALARGMVWVPALRSIGSTLPDAMDSYFAEQAVNFEQQWIGTTTLDAWRRRAVLSTTPRSADWSDIKLVRAGVSVTTLPAANFPLIVELGWQSPSLLPAVGVTLRLQKDGRTWAARDYAAVGRFRVPQRADLVWEQIGFLVPAGLPPGDYQLVIGLVDAQGELRKPVMGADPNAYLLPLATLAITTPTTPVPPFRLSMQAPLHRPVLTQGVALLGSSGGDSTVLAGTFFDLTLFWQNQAAALPDRHLYVSLLDQQGTGIAGWEGWPIPTYPLSQWSSGSLVQTPVTVFVPGTVSTGVYRLAVGWLDPASRTKEPPLVLRTVSVYQRQATFTPTPPTTPLAVPAQFGTHVQLLGYDWQTRADQLDLTLYWQVLQPLLPPHQIFIHLNGAAGATLAQTDDTPQTAAGPAPTGSWQPGEYLVTHHTLTLDASEMPPTGLQVGLYEPTTGARLPLSVAGEPTGDAFLLQHP